MAVQERLHKTYLVPVIVIDDAAKAVDTANAMRAGGVDIMEITLRTTAGLDAIKAVREHCSDMLVGAGTVLTVAQCEQAAACGAQFVVSPGFDLEVVEYAAKHDIVALPGCVTPTEIGMAMRAGLHIVKFFPANVYGGIAAIKALAGPFPNIRFVPTGGVGLSNLSDFVHPAVHAVGGGWLCERAAIQAGNYAAITDICRQSVEIVKNAR